MAAMNDGAFPFGVCSAATEVAGRRSMVPAGLTLACRVMLLRRRLACLARWFGSSIVQTRSVVSVASLFPGCLALRRSGAEGDRLVSVRLADAPGQEERPVG